MSKRRVEHKLDRILAQPLTLGSEQRALNLLKTRPHRRQPWRASSTVPVEALLLLSPQREHNGLVPKKNETKLSLAAAFGTGKAQHLKA
jgi:hypothetical protein